MSGVSAYPQPLKKAASQEPLTWPGRVSAYQPDIQRLIRPCGRLNPPALLLRERDGRGTARHPAGCSTQPSRPGNRLAPCPADPHGHRRPVITQLVRVRNPPPAQQFPPTNSLVTSRRPASRVYRPRAESPARGLVATRGMNVTDEGRYGPRRGRDGERARGGSSSRPERDRGGSSPPARGPQTACLPCAPDPGATARLVPVTCANASRARARPAPAPDPSRPERARGGRPAPSGRPRPVPGGARWTGRPKLVNDRHETGTKHDVRQILVRCPRRNSWET